MSLEALLESVGHEAEASMASRLAAAHSEAEAIHAAAQARVRGVVSTRVAAWEAARRRELDRVVAERATASRRAALVSRAQWIEAVFTVAGERLRGLPFEAWNRRVGALVAGTTPYLPAGRARLVCVPDAAEAVRAALDRSGDCEVVPEPGAAPGVVGEAEDASVVVDNSFAGILARRRDELAMELVKGRDAGNGHVVG